MSEATGSGYGLSRAKVGGRVSAPALGYLPPMPRAYRPRIGVIGCGGISEYHLRAYGAMGLEVVALCNRTREKAERRRAEFFPAASVTTDYREVLARADVDVVDITLHPEERVAAIEAALHAGKHVLSQKPFVLDLDVGERLVRRAKEKGLKLAVNQNGRWAPHFAYLGAAVDAGVIGEVATVNFTLQWDHTWTAGTAFEEVRHLVLIDFGIHWFDMAARLMRGRTARRVWASVEKMRGQKMRPPILAQVAIDYDGGQVRMAFNGHVVHGQEDRTVVCGTRGTLRSFGPSLSEQTVTLHTEAGEAQPELEGTWFTSGFRGAMGELLCAIEEGREPGNGARENLRSLELCFAAIASADRGEAVVPGSVKAASK